MKKLILIFLSLVALFTVMGCSATTSAPSPNNQKIVIKYSTIIYGEP
jgi:uncharacterized protein YcfL